MMRKINEKIDGVFRKIPPKRLDQVLSTAQHGLFALMILMQINSLNFSNVANWGEIESLRLTVITWVGIAWMHWSTSDKRRRQMSREAELAIKIQQNALERERTHQAVLNILDTMDKETLSKYGITIKEEDEKNIKKSS